MAWHMNLNTQLRIPRGRLCEVSQPDSEGVEDDSDTDFSAFAFIPSIGKIL